MFTGLSALFTRSTIAASAMGLAPRNCAGSRPCRCFIDATRLQYTTSNLCVALVHLNASGRSSRAAPSGGNGFATRTSHHDSSVGKCAAGLLPHIDSKFSTSPPYDLRRKSFGEGNAPDSPPRVPSVPLEPTG